MLRVTWASFNGCSLNPEFEEWSIISKRRIFCLCAFFYLSKTEWGVIISQMEAMVFPHLSHIMTQSTTTADLWKTKESIQHMEDGGWDCRLRTRPTTLPTTIVGVMIAGFGHARRHASKTTVGWDCWLRPRPTTRPSDSGFLIAGFGHARRHAPDSNFKLPNIYIYIC